LQGLERELGDLNSGHLLSIDGLRVFTHTIEFLGVVL
jgi:hypothetical protein